MTISASLSDDGTTLCIRVAGRFDPAAQHEALQVCRRGGTRTPRFTVDLRDAEYVDRTALSRLVAALGDSASVRPAAIEVIEPRESRGTALVVDDDIVSRKLLQQMLEGESFRVQVADDGLQAVAAFDRTAPDIIFMDVLMPRMDGYAATRILKARLATRFVPVIFLSSLTNEDGLAACIEAGGDDFLAKPFSQPLLRAKIRAMERIRDLTRTVQQQHTTLNGLFASMQRERDIAERILEATVTSPNFRAPCIQSLLRPAEAFSGDVLLTVQRPDGGISVLLGDFTGHGLVAAVGATPVAVTLRAMVGSGASDAEILRSLDSNLQRLMPAGMFMAAGMISVSADMRCLRVWNGGLPEMFVRAIDGRIRARVGSSHLPLGIECARDDFEPDVVYVSHGESIFLHSDGLAELRNDAAEMFGPERIEQVVQSGHARDVVANIERAIQRFRGARQQDDDVTVAQLILDPALMQTSA